MCLNTYRNEELPMCRLGKMALCSHRTLDLRQSPLSAGLWLTARPIADGGWPMANGGWLMGLWTYGLMGPWAYQVGGVWASGHLVLWAYGR